MRTRHVLVMVTALAVLAAGVPALAAPASDPSTRVDATDWRARQDDYLRWATEDRALSPGSLTSITAHVGRASRDPGFAWDPNALSVAALQGVFDKLSTLEDTSDFDMNRMINLWVGYRDLLPQEVADTFRETILDGKYWWTEPTPEGIIDDQYYWTENHLIFFAANEYIAGQTFPGETFTNDGRTGAQHRAHARGNILHWLALRARFGFSEWLSNVYWMEDLMGVLLLAEWADDDEIRSYASQVLDMMIIELASHLHEGAFGSTHGRSYMKDKMTALDEDTFTMARMMFGDTAHPYQNVDGASFMATVERYRPPAVAWEIVADDGPSVIRQRQSVPVDPLVPVTPNPVAPYGLSYDDPMVWWGQGGQFPWQVVPMSVELLNTYDLFETNNFKPAAALKPIVESGTTEQLQALASSLAPAVNAGLSSEISSVTWRSPDVMLSSAQDWRKGQRSEQGHIWQATLDANAQVFTTHPFSPASTGSSTSDSAGYWTGSGSVPRTAQHENVAVMVYEPIYDRQPGNPIPYFEYETLTHAYFPKEFFDEVVEQDGWTIGRKGDGYVALWSWRPTAWAPFDPATRPIPELTGEFDLVADGGADNVWITEVGRAADWPGADPFGSFVDAVTATEPAVTDLGAKDGFDVDYASPTQGAVAFGWTRPLTVGGDPVQLTGGPRWDTPWATVGWGDLVYEVSAGGEDLTLDFRGLEDAITQVPTEEPPSESTTTTTTTTSTTTGASPATTSTTVTTSTARPRFTG